MDVGIVKLDDIVRNSVTKLYCAFIGKIIKVQNKNNPWYEICNGYGARVYLEVDKKTVACTRREIKDIAFTRKYLLRLIVSDGNQEVHVIVYDTVESFIRCIVIEYVEALFKTNKKELCEYYKKLMLSEDKELKFLVKMDVKKREEKTRKKLIVEEVYKVDAKDINEGSHPNKKLKIEN
ncbi:unnamed protein product [Fraxinus pennsylvanica]|uniref:Uncharacterized protein n=1 Tax=Fraxinus pennsylvanica TaxID=56036 RepID=A0AAD1ZLD4_9LAMI|nr:unnamed protein product [Fraxinus pennsylvanica]